MVMKDIDTVKHYTLADFEAFIWQPENSETIFELINGEIIHVPSNPYVSGIASRIIHFIYSYLEKNEINGHVTGEAGGYLINGNVFAPDVAYISPERQETLPQEGFNPGPPDLAVEVLSNPQRSDEQQTLRRKIAIYLQAGTVVWVVNAHDKVVEVHRMDEDVRILGKEGTLTVEDVLPGFRLPVRAIFAR